MSVKSLIAFGIGGVIVAFANDSLHFGPWAILLLSFVLIYLAGVLTIPDAVRPLDGDSELKPR